MILNIILEKNIHSIIINITFNKNNTKSKNWTKNEVMSIIVSYCFILNF